MASTPKRSKLESEEKPKEFNYNVSWEKQSWAQGWLIKSKNAEKQARCRACSKDLRAHCKDLQKHATNAGHLKNMNDIKSQKTLTSVCNLFDKNKEKKYAILGAMHENDVEKVRELLDQGVNPNFKPKSCESLIWLAVTEDKTEMIKLLVQYGATVNPSLLKYILAYQGNEDSKQILGQWIKMNGGNVKIVQEIFCKLIQCRRATIDYLEFLIDHGLPVDEPVDGSSTPLDFCIKNGVTEFVTYFLKRGVDINKKRDDATTYLCAAVSLLHGNSMMKLFLKRGALVNEKSSGDSTALHLACQQQSRSKVELLLMHGADLNILDNDRRTPLTCVRFYDEEILIKELAELKFKGQAICEENLNYVANDYKANRLYERSLVELQRMDKHKFYNGYSLYDIFKMRWQRKKLILLTQNEDFVVAFKTFWNRKMFENFGEDLDRMFQEAVCKRDDLLAKEKELFSLFKNYIPGLAIRKIADYAVFGED